MVILLMIAYDPGITENFIGETEKWELGTTKKH